MFQHRCTVVGNPERVFLANSFEAGTWGCEKIRGWGGGRVLLHFYVEVFQKPFWGYMRCPLPPPLPPPPLCSSWVKMRGGEREGEGEKESEKREKEIKEKEITFNDKE